MNSNDAAGQTFIELDAEGPLSQLTQLVEVFPRISGGQALEDLPAGPVRNARRASHTVDALLAYGKRVYSTQGVGEEPLEQTIRDFLSDLKHLCDLLDQQRPDEGFDLPTLFSRAYEMTIEETDGVF